MRAGLGATGLETPIMRYAFVFTLLAAGIVAACAPTMAAPSVRAPEVWLCHNHPEPLGREPDQWYTVQRRLDVMQLAINAVAYLIPQDDLGRLASLLRRNGIGVSIECGYFDWDPHATDFTAPNPKPITDRPRAEIRHGIGKATARLEMAKIAPMLRAGMRPDYIVMDGPIRRLMNPGADTGRTTAKGEQQGLATLEEAVAEVIAYMREWRRRFPGVRFLALTNFPNWGWKGQPAYWASGPDSMFWGDYYPVITALIERTRAARMPLAGLVIDNPYEYTTATIPVESPWPPPSKSPRETDWMARVIELERYAEGKGLDVSLIVNSQRGGYESDEAFVRYTLEYLNAYRAAGGSPRRYVFQTWYRYPRKLVPETDPFSMTGMLREAIGIIKGAH